MEDLAAVKERFRSFVLESDDDEGDGGCDLWCGQLDKDGYGRFKWDGEPTRANITAYELFIGPVPEGHVVRHSCDHPRCVRWRGPRPHLGTGTHLDNMDDKVRRGRQRGSEKIPRQQVEALRERATKGRLRGKKINLAREAKRLGVSKSTISMALKGKTWKVDLEGIEI